jgi:hypothetical protein
VHRTLVYTDYRPPRFTFKSDMRFEAGEKFNLIDLIGATDLIDGDISEKVKLISSELNASVPGVYNCQAQVTNSKGDVSYLEFTVTIAQAANVLQELLSQYVSCDRRHAETEGEDLHRASLLRASTQPDRAERAHEPFSDRDKDEIQPRPLLDRHHPVGGSAGDEVVVIGRRRHPPGSGQVGRQCLPGARPGLIGCCGGHRLGSRSNPSH